MPVLLGRVDGIRAAAASKEIPLDGIGVLDPEAATNARDRLRALLDGLQVPGNHEQLVRDPHWFASLMVASREADAVVGGPSVDFAATLDPALSVMPLEPGRSIASSVLIVVVRDKPYFFTDCTVNVLPDASELAEIAIGAARLMERSFDSVPRVAMLSYSNLGSMGGEEPDRMRRAIELVREHAPDVAIGGEMHAETAVLTEMLLKRDPLGPLSKAANVLVFPNLAAAKIAYQLLRRLGNADVIGPVMTGPIHSVHALWSGAGVGDVVNLTAMAVADAQRKASVVSSG